MTERGIRRIVQVAGSLVTLGFGCAYADFTDTTVLSQFDPVQQRAALTNQAVYDRLSQPDIGCNTQSTGGGVCGGAIFTVWQNVRALVDNANELGCPCVSSTEPTQFSPHLDIKALAAAVQFTSAVEFAALEEAASRYARSQQDIVANRINALHAGESARQTLGGGDGKNTVVPVNPGALGGGASADSDSIVSKLGIYIDGSYEYGRRSDTANSGGAEDGYRFDSENFTLGADYRLRDALVLGLTAGHLNQATRFDASSSIVDAHFGARGYSALGYFLWEPGDFFVSASLGGQWLDNSTTRDVIYSSTNPATPAVDGSASGKTESNALIATANLGYDARWKSFTAEPYLKAQYQRVDIDGFTETGASAPGYDQTIGAQREHPIDTAIGVKLQQALTPAFGVMVPFARAEFHQEFENRAQNISAVYSAIAALNTSAAGIDFDLPTDKPDDDYWGLAAGASMVLPHGIQGFLQYQQIFGLKPYTDHTITGGARFEF